jgi:UDP-N-acetylmuramate--alanine ligase
MEHIHLVGIGGSGLSAIARILLESGYIVSGSDRQLTPVAEQLSQAGAQIVIGHHPEHVIGADLVIRSSAVMDDNPEVLAAKASGIPVLKRAEFLGKLTADRQVIAVAGTHGKTTTTAMLSWMFSFLSLNPSFIIGGVSHNLGTNAHAGNGDYFIIEADEYDRMFLGLRPGLAVVTNIEYDHPDCFPTRQDYFQAFMDFANCVKENGTLIACIDDPGSAQLIQYAKSQGRNTASYGFDSTQNQVQPDFKAIDINLNEFSCYRFTLIKKGQALAEVSLQVPGEHNVRNALGTLAVADQLNLPLSEAVHSLGEFQGTGRRFEVKGEIAGVTVIDDYAHHPSEIRATLASARVRFNGHSVWAVWQPHTYSRTRLFFDEFANAFIDADHVLVTEDYGAREESPGDFSAMQLVQAMDHIDAHFVPGIKEATEYLIDRLKAGDILIVLSAGDADQIGTNIMESLSHDRSAIHARR